MVCLRCDDRVICKLSCAKSKVKKCVCASCALFIIFVTIGSILFYQYYVYCGTTESRTYCSPFVQHTQHLFKWYPNPLTTTEFESSFNDILSVTKATQSSPSIANDAPLSMADTNIYTPPICYPQWENPCPDKIEMVYLMTQHRGGSNFITYMLEGHPQIIGDLEVTSKWWHQSCSLLGQVLMPDHCDATHMWDQFTLVAKQFFDRPIAKKQCSNPDPNNKLVYTIKVQIGDIPPHLFHNLTHYIYCHNVSVVQMLRQAAIAAFWNYQADTMERVATKDPSLIAKREWTNYGGYGRVDSLSLDGWAAHKHVTWIEGHRHNLRDMLRYYPRPIKFFSVFYEDLIGPYSVSYFDAMQNFFQVENQVNATSFRRKHPKPCYSKMPNWVDVKQALVGMDSYYACEKEST